MTIKKNYERDSIELRKPKGRVVKNRETTRVKLALRHCDLAIVLDDDELESLDDPHGFNDIDDGDEW